MTFCVSSFLSLAKKKQKISPLLLFWLVPSPRHLAKRNPYCNGVTLVVQAAMAVELNRITASPKEQK
jgi:hypothetical protein